MPTIREVAQAASVGVGTASRALSGSPHVADATRVRVQAAAERLGFRPSPIARAFSRGRTQTIQVVVPLITQHFYVEVLRGIEAALSATEYALLIRTIERRADRARVLREPEPRRRMDGALLVSLTPNRGLVTRAARSGLPVVLVDSEHPLLSSVAVDHTAAAATAVRHLLEEGHRRIALVDHPEDPFAPVYPDARHRGYRQALAEAGVAPRPEYERVTDFSPSAGYAAMRELLALAEPPTAVFAGSDSQAVGVLEAARAYGRRVPDHLAVVGYNDIELAAYLGLTTVHVPMREIGRRGLQLLLRAIEQPEAPPEHVRLPAELVVRDTSVRVRRRRRGARG
jgi:LacI family transcriptional regulator/LacI family repressor for deo operon, udp, cdd, tsx, nupC, and nupG